MSVTIYTTAICPYCVNAKRLLDSKNISFTEIKVDSKPHLREEMMQQSGRHTVPQIWFGEYHVGGFTELWALDRKGELKTLLQA